MNPFCAACNHEHGTLYLCPHYSVEQMAAVHRGRAKFAEWALKQSLLAWFRNPRFVHPPV